VQARWTDQILDEVFVNIRENRQDLPSELLDRTRTLMVKAVRDRLRTLSPALGLPDPDDRHVLAAAIRLNAKVVWSCVQQIANSWRNPPGTIADVLTSLERCGLMQSVAELRAL
jgi:hypothetical protein